MRRERWLRVKEILATLLDLPESERAAALRAACAGDSELEAEVASLLAGEGTPLLLDLASMDLAAPEAHSVAPGTRLGPYEVAELIGAGGMGAVYRGRDTRLGREVAVKVVGTPGLGQQRRLEREARAASTLNHPNILTLFDVGFESGVQYVVTELLQGCTLRSQLAQGTPDVETALDWIAQIASGLEAAHASGVIHRDLKPENLFVTKAGLVKILDFGLAKQLEPDASQAASDDAAGRTVPGTVLGTVGYMAPEQVRGHVADTRSDVFSFGAVAYELLTGERAFRGDSPADTLGAILRDSPPPASTLRKGLPTSVDRLLERCLAKQPEERPASGAELRKAVAALQAGDPQSLPRGSGRTRPWVVAAALALAALVSLFALRGRLPTSGPIAVGSTGRRAVAVMAFEDHTGDPGRAWLARGVPSLLVAGLAETRALDVVGTQRLDSVIAQLQSDGALDRSPVEAARRSGAGALLGGSILKAGNGVRIDVRLEDLRTGKVLLAESVSGADVLALSDDLVGRIRAGLAVDDRSSARPIAELTTTSLEAYQLYVKGLEARHNNRLVDARRFLLEAVRLDASFGPAWAHLSQVAHGLAQQAEATEYRRKALANAQRLPERQRLLIEAGDPHDPSADKARAIRLLSTLLERFPDDEEGYDLLTHFYEPDLKKMLPLFERWRRMVPSGGSPLLRNHYGYALLAHGLYTEAQREFEANVRMRPDEPNSYDSLGEFFLLSGRPQKALDQYERALAVNPAFDWSLVARAWAFGMLGRYDDAFQAFDRMRGVGSSGATTVMLPFCEAFLQSRVGRFRDAARVIRERQALAVKAGLTGGSPAYHVLSALLDFERGRFSEANTSIAAAQRALAESRAPEYWRESMSAIVRVLVGTAAARSGDLDAARSQLAALGVESAAGERLARWTRHGLAGEIALAAGNPAEARAAFERGLPDPRLEVNVGGGPLFVLANALPTRDGIARAQAAEGDLAGALEEYRRLLEPQASSRWPTALEPRYVLARAVLAQRLGQAGLATAERRRFRELWKQADAELSQASVAQSLFGNPR